MSTVTDIAHQVIDPLVESYLDVQAMAIALAERAAALGLVVTIEREMVYAEPAMGNFGLRVEVQPRRDNGGPHVIGYTPPAPEDQEKMLDMAQRRKNLEGNDAMVGRRRRHSSAGGGW